MTSLNVTRQTKDTFDQLQPDDYSQDQFIQELLTVYQRDTGQVVDPDGVVSQITRETASEIELSAMRGVVEGWQKIKNDTIVVECDCKNG